MSEPGETTAGELPGFSWTRLPWLAIATAGVTLLALALLISGGAAAALGAWLLATAAPLGLGMLVRQSWAAAIPVLFWAGWIAATKLQPVDGELPRTPIGLAVVFAIAGVAATVFAQRSIAPAADAETDALREREIPSIDDALETVPELETPGGEPDADAAVDDALLEALLAEPEAHEDEADDEDEDEQPEAEAEADEDEQPEAEAEADEDEQPEAETDADDEDEQLDAEADPRLAELEAVVASVQAAATGEHEVVELASDQDRGQAIEFEAIKVDDIDLDDAPLPAQTHAGRRKRR